MLKSPQAAAALLCSEQIAVNPIEALSATLDVKGMMLALTFVLTVTCSPQLSQVRQAAASLERVAGAMARQAAIEHHGRDNRTAFTVGSVENRDQHREQRRASTSISF